MNETPTNSMIDQSSKPVSWALLLYELEDAVEHLAALVRQMNEHGRIDEEDYRIQLGPVYAHLNRAWNSRSSDNESPAEQDPTGWSRFPDDLNPIG
jgi:hypothetical protein